MRLSPLATFWYNFYYYSSLFLYVHIRCSTFRIAIAPNCGNHYSITNVPTSLFLCECKLCKSIVKDLKFDWSRINDTGHVKRKSDWQMKFVWANNSRLRTSTGTATRNVTNTLDLSCRARWLLYRLLMHYICIIMSITCCYFQKLFKISFLKEFK